MSEAVEKELPEKWVMTTLSKVTKPIEKVKPADEPEKQITTGKAEVDDREGRKQRDDDLADGNSDGHHQTVEEHRCHRHVHAGKERGGVVLDQLISGPKRHRGPHDFGLCDGCFNKSKPDREGDDQNSDDHQRVGKPKARPAFFDHAMRFLRHQ